MSPHTNIDLSSSYFCGGTPLRIYCLIKYASTSIISGSNSVLNDDLVAVKGVLR